MLKIHDFEHAQASEDAVTSTPSRFVEIKVHQELH